MRYAPLVLAPAFAAAAIAGPALAVDPVKSGAAEFQQRCAACHSASASDKGFKAGPNLAGVMGRKAGTFPKFRYSKAMAATGFQWDAGRLDAFLAAPRKVVPGTTMPLSVPDAESRRAIVAYLGSRK